jgi:pimeloyl-ACP methyl ester carboxylesterase
MPERVDARGAARFGVRRDAVRPGAARCDERPGGRARTPPAGETANAGGAVNLLLLPGLLSDQHVWAPVRSRLPAGIDCAVPDYPNERSVGAMAERVLASAPATFALAGHSMGGRVALEIVRRAPERVRRLALLDTGFRPRLQGPAGDEERAARLALLALARDQGMRRMAQVWMQPMLHPARLADAALTEAILDMFERHTPAQFAGQIDALLARPDAADLLPRIGCPALVLCGREDAWSPPARHEEMASLLPGSRLAIVERCGHMSPLEEPDAVAKALLEWLRQEDAATAKDRECAI